MSSSNFTVILKLTRLIAHKQLSVPSQPISNSQNRYKYLVTRESILQHLLSNASSDVYTFNNTIDGEFDNFLDRQRPYFIMCHDHGVSLPPISGLSATDGNSSKSGSGTLGSSEDAEKTVLLLFIWHVMDLGYTIGLTNEVEFSDSKACF